MNRVKSPSVAGMFYPFRKDEIQSMIEDYMRQAELKEYTNIKGLIAPHAGYIYSGLTAACGYKQLTSLSSKKWKVFVMAPSHFTRFTGVSVGDYDTFETPLGKIPVETTIVKDLLKDENFDFCLEAYEQEHALEVHLPFLQSVFEEFSLIPLIFGEADYEACAKILNKYYDEDTLFIASSDLSHFYTSEKAEDLDHDCINTILNQDIEAMKTKEACGKGPILTLMSLAKLNNWKFELMDYRHSGDVIGDNDRVVGYSSIICTGI